MGDQEGVVGVGPCPRSSFQPFALPNSYLKNAPPGRGFRPPVELPPPPLQAVVVVVVKGTVGGLG